MFDEIAGLWIGNYEHPSKISLEEIIMNVLKDDYKFPIIKSDNFGHIDKKTVIPIGARAKIDTTKDEVIKKDEDIKDAINRLTDEMLKYAQNLEFEKAAELRDKIKELENYVES